MQKTERYYPSLLLPYEYQVDDLHMLTPSRPIKPEYPKIEYDDAESPFGWLIFGGLVFGFILSFRNPYVYLPIWLLVTIVVIVNNVNKEKERKRIHEHKRQIALQQFNKDKDQFHGDSEWFDYVTKLLAEDSSFIQKRALYLNRKLIYKNIEIFEDKSAKKGYSEKLFSDHVAKHFGSHIKENKRILDYYPDFIYIDKQSGLHLVIEIDEPYTLEERKPIHCEGEDDFRDEQFSDLGWPTLRFAESQVIQSTSDCIETIRRTIKYLNKDLDYWSVAVPKVSRWDEEKAKALSDEKYRESYLNIEVIKKYEKPTDLENDLPF